MTSWITICDTCKRDDWVPDTTPDGAILADLIEPLAGGPVRTRRHSCLMGCTHGCNITVQAQGKICYTLGRFEPTPEAAAAIVAWARLHADSATGQVPYRTWPEPVKGHFVTRHLPLPEPE
jgi:predicted metal-binding protein